MTDTEENQSNIVPLELGRKREKIVAESAQFWTADTPERITYSHSTMCQTSLPFVKSDNREWKNKNGNSIVLIEAGQVYDPAKEDLVKVALPYGTKPRLILLDWNRQAKLTGSPVIEVEDTLYAFLKRLKLPTEGRVYDMTKKQLSSLAACHMTLGRPEEGRGNTDYGRIVSNLDVLFAKDESQRLLWPNTVTLSTDYFESLMVHAVPLDEAALFLLKDSALELDLYAMFAERLHRIHPDKPHFVHWAGLWDQYGKGYKRINNFRAKFRHHLMNVQAVYPDAQIEDMKSSNGTPRGLLLKHSKPPVRKLMVTVAKGVSKPVES